MNTCPMCQSTNFNKEPHTLYLDANTYANCNACPSRFWILDEEITSIEVYSDPICVCSERGIDDLYHYTIYIDNDIVAFGNPTLILELEYVKNLLEKFIKLRIFL